MNAEQTRSVGALAEAVGTLVERTLDALPITDIAYLHFDYTRPLVEDLLLTLDQHVDRGARVLVVGGNSLLAQAIVAAGYQLHLWRFGDNILTDDLEEQLRGRLTPAILLSDSLPFTGGCFEAIVLPLVLEHVRTSPSAVLASMQQYLSPAGIIIVASENLSSLARRRRAVQGKSHLPGWLQPAHHVALNWPDLPAIRFYTRGELLDYAQEAGLRDVATSYSVGRRAVNEASPPTLGTFVGQTLVHLVQRSVPSLRDHILLTLETAGAMSGPPGDNMATDGSAARHTFPLVSVVLPTHNRSALLRDCFAGLLQQTYPTDRFEVVLINDNSQDDTDVVARELVASSPFHVRYIKTSGLGATAARNLGMREARGDIVGHLDDDNRPVPHWLDAAVRGFGKDVAVVGGPVTPKPEQPVPFFAFTANYQEELGIYPTANVFYRREVALAAGGFDESFDRSVMGRPVWGWDCDMAWRLRRLGYRTRFRAGVVAYQEVIALRPRAWLAEGWRMIVLPTAVQRVPELGHSLLVHRFFADDASYRFDLAMLGAVVALTRRRTWPIPLALPYAALFWPLVRESGGRPWRWPKLGLKITLMVVRHSITFVALLAGSAKAKRLVL